MKNPLATLIIALSMTLSLWAGDGEGPYPVIFIHDEISTGTNTGGWALWDDSHSHMRVIVDAGYNGYTYGAATTNGSSATRGQCNVNSTVSSTSDPKKVYNFSFYNSDGSRGVIGNNYSSGTTLYPSSANPAYPTEYATSVASGEWANNLALFIDKVLAATGADKVSLVCFGMSGLIARDAINFNNCSNKVYKLLMIGTASCGYWYDPFVASIYDKEFSGFTGWQKNGELLEMGIGNWFQDDTVARNAAFPFYKTSSTDSTMWTSWLNAVDKPLITNLNRNDAPPFYATIAGTRPRSWTIIYGFDIGGGGLVIYYLPSNDGVVERRTVDLSWAQWNRAFWRFHQNRGSDAYNACLPTCDPVDNNVKHWIFDYHTPPVITKVVWTKTSGSQSTMSMMSPVAKYKGTVYFTYTETPGWKTKRFRCWRKGPSDSDYYIHDRLFDESKRSYVGRRNVPAGQTWCFKVEAVHNYKSGSEQLLMGAPFCSAPPATSPPKPACPMLYSFSEYDTSYFFDQENTLLAHSEVILDTMDDYLLLSHPLSALNRRYYLKISEDSTATSYFDVVKLFVVDHPAATGLAVTADGDPVVYSDLILPNECFYYDFETVEDTLGEPYKIAYPVDLLDQVLDIDTQTVVSADMDSFFVTFPEPPSTWSSTVLLMTTASVPYSSISPVKNYQYTAYMKVNDTLWDPVPGGQAFARHYPSTWAAELPSSTLMSIGEEDGIILKIVCSAGSEGFFNSIALVNHEETGWSMSEAPMDTATRWELAGGVPTATDVGTQLRLKDMIMAPVLQEGDQYSLCFVELSDTTDDSTLVRDFILMTHGVFGYGIIAPTSLEESTNHIESYSLQAEQLLSKGHPVKILYQIPKSGSVEISIIDAAGRYVTELVHENKKAGTYTLNWNGQNASGQTLSSGIYFIRMVSGGFTSSKKVIVLD